MNGPDTDMASDSELDASLGWRCNQGRGADWPQPDIPWKKVDAIVAVIGVVVLGLLFSGALR